MLNEFLLITKIGVARITRRTLFFSIMFALSACSSDGDATPDNLATELSDFSMALPTLRAIAGDSQIKLIWDAVPNSASYTLCHAAQSLPADLSNCTAHTNGTLVQNLGTSVEGTSATLKSHRITGLVNDTTYYFALVAIHSGGNQSLPSSQISATPISFSPMLNDTGITRGGNYPPSGNNTDCTGATIAQQDCSHGRDVTHNDGSDGHAGFSFTKLDSTGTALAASASVWRCVQDNVTGFIWEVKTNDGGLHDKNDTYNWYNTDSSTNGGAVGFANDDGNICEGYVNGQPATYCNTQAFTARVNAAGLCGATDWRLPTRPELTSIVNYATTVPAIDTVYFPITRFSYWSSSPYAYDSDDAWIVNFSYGNDDYGNRSGYNSVRLVGSGQ